MTAIKADSLIAALITAAEQLDWTCEIYEDGSVDFRKYSPSGEDFSICVSADTIAEEVRSAADSFDVDEHVATWLDAARHGIRGVPSARVLVEDAEEIEAMLRELSNALSRAQNEYECSSLDTKVNDALSRSTTPAKATEQFLKSPSR